MTEVVKHEGQKPTKSELVSSTASLVLLPPLQDAAIIKTRQNDIRKNLLSLDTEIHEVAFQCLMHADKHGDTTLFKRLLMEIIDDKTGYRRQGLIGWMREYSPMVLDGMNIKLSGTFNGDRKPFRLAEAYANPFTTLKKLRETLVFKPSFRDGLIQKMKKSVKDFKDSENNTKLIPGELPQPKDISKTFYVGSHMDEMAAGFAEIDVILTRLQSFDDRMEDIFKANVNAKKAELDLKELHEQGVI